ncbi:hypothetical protein JCM9957A_66160 [Kineosporia succinea]
MLASVGLAVGGVAGAGPVRAADATGASVKVANGTAKLGGGCIQLRTTIRPPAGATSWDATTEVDETTGSGYSSGSTDAPATGTLQHCPTLEGVGRFHWTSTLTYRTGDSDTESTASFSGTYTIAKARRTGTLKISDRTPRYGQKVTFRTCIPGPRYVDYKLQVQVGKTKIETSPALTTGSRGCDSLSAVWPKSKLVPKYRLYVPGEDTINRYVGPWLTVRGHA